MREDLLLVLYRPYNRPAAHTKKEDRIHLLAATLWPWREDLLVISYLPVVPSKSWTPQLA